MSMGNRCRCGNRGAWRVLVRHGNFSAFNGYRFAPSDYSSVTCDRDEGGCGAVWRTKARYADRLSLARFVSEAVR